MKQGSYCTCLPGLKSRETILGNKHKKKLKTSDQDIHLYQRQGINRIEGMNIPKNTRKTLQSHSLRHLRHARLTNTISCNLCNTRVSWYTNQNIDHQQPATNRSVYISLKDYRHESKRNRQRKRNPTEKKKLQQITQTASRYRLGTPDQESGDWKHRWKVTCMLPHDRQRVQDYSKQEQHQLAKINLQEKRTHKPGNLKKFCSQRL